MAKIYTGKARALDLTVTKYENCVAVRGYPKKYSPLSAFESFPKLSIEEYVTLDSSSFINRLNGFKIYMLQVENCEVIIEDALMFNEKCNIMKGEIKYFYGALSDITEQWFICDGTKGTPDMRGRVAVGIIPGELITNPDPNTQYDEYRRVGNTGGVSVVELTGKQMPKHGHFAEKVRGDDGSGNNYYYCSSMGNAGDRRIHSPDGVTLPPLAGGRTGESGADEPHENRQPFIVLVPIMYNPSEIWVKYE